jgi:hypothetical protein
MNPMIGNMNANPMMGNMNANPMMGNMNPNPMMGNMNPNPMMGNVNTNPMMGNMNANPMINNMNQNPMMNNNMNANPMGMNNQLMTNMSMDNTALKLKAIIDPYEQKITELEKKIKEKDFEILVLNEKLEQYKTKEMLMNNQINFNNNINMVNPMLMNNNVNWMDCYNNLGNNNFMNFGLANINNMNNNNDPSKWKIIFSYKDKEYKELCHCDEKTEKAFRRFCKKIGIKYKNVKFIHDNNKGIYPSLTFAEAGICNDSKIHIIEIKANNNIDNEEEEESDSEGKCECEGPKYSVIFTTTQGLKTNIVISGDRCVDTLLKTFLARLGQINLYFEKSNKICFIFDGSQLKFGDKRKIKDYFGHFNNNPKVVVNDVHNLIGA